MELLIVYVYREDKAAPDVDAHVCEWRRAMSVEVLLEFSKQPELLRAYAEYSLENRVTSVTSLDSPLYNCVLQNRGLVEDLTVCFYVHRYTRSLLMWWMPSAVPLKVDSRAISRSTISTEV